MFCRKCGNEIPDDSVFCLKCGTKVEYVETEVIESIIQDEEKEDVNSNELIDTEINDEFLNTSEKINVRGVVIALAVVLFLAFISVYISKDVNKCKFDSCDEEKEVDSDYCYYHTCKEKGCTSSKLIGDSYCYSHKKEHQCTVDRCINDRYGESEYCSEHKCAKTGCTNKSNRSGDYCDEHTVDMRTRLDMITFNFSLNSAGGIELDFRATNKSRKEIKYVRFDITMQNAVGDRLTDDIKGDYTIPVEIIGPVKAGKEVYMSDELVGYCDNCARIDVNDVTIIYTDGTSETGRLGYYAD